MARSRRSVGFLTILVLAWAVPPAAAGPPAPDWWSEVRSRIEREEYRVTWQTATGLPEGRAAWHAPNRAQDLRTYFTSDGIRVVARTGEPGWEWGVALRAWGRPGAMRAAEPARLSPRDNRFEYDRDGIVEWFVNDRRGLEQGFTLAAPPPAPAGSAPTDEGPLVLELAVAGDLAAHPSRNGRAIDFVSSSGIGVLRYAQLVVVDASGRELPARMEALSGANGPAIQLIVEDPAAVYPVTVDPLVTSASWSPTGETEISWFGFSVGTAGDVDGDGYSDLIVGAPRFDNGQVREGRAYLFRGSAAGPSTFPDWTVESDLVGAELGYSVATAGDVNGDGFADAIVGVRTYTNGESNEGQARVYHGSSAGLSTTADWSVESNNATALFGQSVGTAGDVNGDGYSDAIVGAPQYDGGQNNEGKAWVYLGSPTGLLPVEHWSVESNVADTLLGLSVATAGDVDGDGYADVIVGVHQHTGAETWQGRVDCYRGSAAGLSSTADWTVEGELAGDNFGWSVAPAGDVDGDGYADVIVGAPLHDDGEFNEGKVYVFTGSASGLQTVAAWTAQGDQVSARLGEAVSTAGDIDGDGYAEVLVGANRFDGGEVDEGAAFLFRGSSSGVEATSSWSFESDQADAELGSAVATAGDVNGDGYSDVIVGAYRYDDAGTDEGRAFLFLGAPAGISSNVGWTVAATQADAGLGSALATAGDVNGDGFADVIVGAPSYDGGEADEGAAFVYLGSASGLGPTPDWQGEGNQASAAYGASVATAGDVDGDGYSDVIVGAPGFGNGEAEEGRALLYRGSPTGLDPVAAWTAEGGAFDVRFGTAVSTAGDVNGDGFADVVVGAPGDPSDERVDLFFGSRDGLSATPDWSDSLEIGIGGAGFGAAVAHAGDLDADGYSDLVVGAPYFTSGSFPRGLVRFYLGSPSGLTLHLSIGGDTSFEEFGYSVSTAGDVNGDGYSDAIVGARAYSIAGTEGRAVLYYGGPSGPSDISTSMVTGPSSGALLGSSVSGAGDVNGDGYADVVVGAPGYENGEVGEGAAIVYLGGPVVSPFQTPVLLEGDVESARLGTAVASAGDVDGDGDADVIVGAPLFGGGRVFLYHGNGGAGIVHAPRLRRLDDSGPIAPQGVGDRDAALLKVLAQTPFGRGRIKLEWEMKPFGIPFDGVGTGVGQVWTDAPAGAPTIEESVTGLAPGTAYRWRVRLRYDPVSHPYQPAGRWMTMPWNAWTETDFRTGASADLSVAQSGDVDPLAVGAQVAYTITIDNDGPDDDVVRLEGTLDSRLELDSVVPGQGSCDGAGTAWNCSLGTIPASGTAIVTVIATGVAAGEAQSQVVLLSAAEDPTDADRIALETTTVVEPAAGDFAWEDLDGDGVQDPGEPGLPDVIVVAYDAATGSFVAATATDANGFYRLPGLTVSSSYVLRFLPPVDLVPTAPDQAGDDTLDSDVDPATLETPVFSLVDPSDVARWDAGFVASCIPPDEPIFIEATHLGPMDETVLSFQDFNQPSQTTGYNVYRSDTAAVPPSSWPQVASNAVDGDEATPNLQWADTSGEFSPTGIWFYLVTAFNARCPAEGPF